MFRLILASLITAALVMAGPASLQAAFTVDGTANVSVATVTVTGTPAATLGDPAYFVVGGTTPADPETIAWSDVESGVTEWKTADNYIRIDYDANQTGWGIQIYTDNTAADANPRYADDAPSNEVQKPAGLVRTDGYQALPMAWNAFDDQSEAGPDENGYGNPVEEIVGDQYRLGRWQWLKDKGNLASADPEDTDWFDAESYVTLVNSDGVLGWGVVRYSATHPIDVFLAGRFNNAEVEAQYGTNKLTLELYHQ